MTPSQARSEGDWIVLDEFVDDAGDPSRSPPSVRPSVISNPVSQQITEMTRDMVAAQVETSEIVRRVLEIVGPCLESNARDAIQREIENQIRDYHDSLTG